MNRQERADLIGRLCKKYGCTNGQATVHYDQFVFRNWHPHPDERFVEWWKRHPDMVSEGYEQARLKNDCVIAWNAQCYRDQFSEAVSMGTLDEIPESLQIFEERRQRLGLQDGNPLSEERGGFPGDTIDF